MREIIVIDPMKVEKKFTVTLGTMSDPKLPLVGDPVALVTYAPHKKTIGWGKVASIREDQSAYDVKVKRIER